jgi:hypothetical protein
VIFARGFKKYAETVAADFRGELRLTTDDRFDPFVGAESLGIPVLPLEDLRPICESMHFARVRDGRAFSALTVICEGKSLIVYNDAHTDTRINNSLAHELAHALLQHEPQPFANGVRLRYREEEAEADYLAGLLLIPNLVAVRACRDSEKLASIAARFGVSDQLLKYRINVSGARRRVIRTYST